MSRVPGRAVGKQYSPRHAEDVIHRHIVQWLRILQRQGRLRAVFFHPPNGGARGFVEAARFKGLGVEPGVPDLIFIVEGGSCACMEVKAPEGRLSQAQLAFQAYCELHGIPYVVVRGIDQAQRAVNGWGLVKPFDQP